MAEETDQPQLFHREVKKFIENIRNYLCKQNPTPSLLADADHAVDCFRGGVLDIDADSFRSIVERIAIVLRRHIVAETIPTKIEVETIELAVDWLAQLAILHQEDLPEPKALVAELLYTFDLVERSQGAVSLAELVATHGASDANKRVDPFLEDPEFDVQGRVVSSRCDPFADDPGFGLEFDLLQRTINFVVETHKIEDDPFNADPSMNIEGDENPNFKTIPASSSSPYDIFAGDPPLADG